MREALGVIAFAIVASSAWIVSRPLTPGGDPGLRASGALLLVPFALFGLFWVGLGTPFESTTPENRMRYGVLLAAAAAITTGFVLLYAALAAAGERLHSTLALALCLLSGAACVVWTSFQLGFWAVAVCLGGIPEAMAVLNNILDALLFAAGALAYLATAAFARALGRARWLGRGSSLANIGLNTLALALLLVRGVTFPVPSGVHEAWYTRPGFIVGIPAVPWLMPYFLGAAILRRHGEPGADLSRAGQTDGIKAAYAPRGAATDQ